MEKLRYEFKKCGPEHEASYLFEVDKKLDAERK